MEIFFCGTDYITQRQWRPQTKYQFRRANLQPQPCFRNLAAHFSGQPDPPRKLSQIFVDFSLIDSLVLFQRYHQYQIQVLWNKQKYYHFNWLFNLITINWVYFFSFYFNFSQSFPLIQHDLFVKTFQLFLILIQIHKTTIFHFYFPFSQHRIEKYLIVLDN